MSSLKNMCFNIPTLKELKNKRFIIVDKLRILLLFSLALKSLWGGTCTFHIYWKDFLVLQHSWESEEYTGCSSRGTQQFGDVVRPVRELLIPGVCSSHSFWLVTWKSYRIPCEVCRGFIVVACLIKLSCLVVVLSKYDMSMWSVRVLVVF